MLFFLGWNVAWQAPANRELWIQEKLVEHVALLVGFAVVAPERHVRVKRIVDQDTAGVELPPNWCTRGVVEPGVLECKIESDTLQSGCG